MTNSFEPTEPPTAPVKRRGRIPGKKYPRKPKSEMMRPPRKGIRIGRATPAAVEAEDTLAAYLQISALLALFSVKARRTILAALNEKYPA